MPVNPKGYKEVICLLNRRARGHRLIAGITLAAACVVFIAGVVLTYRWTEEPLSGLVGPENISSLNLNITPLLVVINSLKILSLAAIYYLGYLLASVHRYNIRLSGHYVSRSYALKLLPLNTRLTPELVTNILDPNIITLDKLPIWAENRPFSAKMDEAPKSKSVFKKLVIDEEPGVPSGYGTSQTVPNRPQ